MDPNFGLTVLRNSTYTVLLNILRKRFCSSSSFTRSCSLYCLRINSEVRKMHRTGFDPRSSLKVKGKVVPVLN
jgi:hypothetical protein